jgi:type IV pilus assembly protein PilM
MLNFVQNWFAPRCNPIGVDFGTDSLRLAQVQFTDGEWRLIGAASADVPTHVRQDPVARAAYFIETTRDLLAQGGFHGRTAVLSLPSAQMHIQHLRVGKMDEQTMKKALRWEAHGKIPIPANQAVLRHIVAGEVYVDQEMKQEVIVLAAARSTVDQMLAAAVKARLEVVGMNVEPLAILDCFTHIYRRQADAETTFMFVDIGCSGTRAFISRGGQILFARSIPVGGEQFCAATATALNIDAEQAKTLRLTLCNSAPPVVAPTDGVERRADMSVPEQPSQPISEATETLLALSSAQPMAAVPAPRLPDPMEGQRRQVHEACQDTIKRLVQELNLCRRYYEATFPAKPVDKLIFVGGEANQRPLCQQIAREMGLAAQVGDPMCRLSKWCEPSADGGMDRRVPQPAWTTAIGLSFGPVAETDEMRLSNERAA